MQRLPVYLIIAVFCTFVLACTYGSVLLPASAGFILLFLITAVLVIDRDLNTFYLLCAGVPAVVVVASASLISGIPAALLLLAAFAAATGEINSRRGIISFSVFSIIFILLCIPLPGITHSLPWLLVIAIFTFVAVFLLLIAEYRIKTQYKEKGA